MRKNEKMFFKKTKKGRGGFLTLKQVALKEAPRDGLRGHRGNRWPTAATDRRGQRLLQQRRPVTPNVPN